MSRRGRAWRVAAACVAALLVAPIPPARADLLIREKLTDGSGRALGERRSVYAGTKARIDTPGFTVIADLDRGRGYLVDHARRVYAEIEPRQVQAGAGAAARELVGGLQGALRGLEDLERVRVVRTRETRAIRGAPAQKVEAYRGSQLVLEAWCSSRVTVRDLRAFMDQAAARGQGGQTLLPAEAQLLRETRDLGYPVLVRYPATGLTLEVEEVSEARQADALFASPAGYRRVGWSELFPGF